MKWYKIFLVIIFISLLLIYVSLIVVEMNHVNDTKQIQLNNYNRCIEQSNSQEYSDRLSSALQNPVLKERTQSCIDNGGCMDFFSCNGRGGYLPEFKFSNVNRRFISLTLSLFIETPSLVDATVCSDPYCIYATYE